MRRLSLGGRINLSIVVVAMIAPSVLPEFQVRLLTFVGITAIITLGLVLLTNVCGLTSFGQAAFMGVGAYTTAYLTTAYPISPWLGLAAGLLLTAAVAVVIGFVTLRLSGPFLPVGTMAWGIALSNLLGNLAFLGRQNGITGIPPINLLGRTIAVGPSGYYLVWISLLAAVFGARNLLNSRTGRAMRALRGNAAMAASFGVSPTRLRLVVFLCAALLAAFAGWLYAHLLAFVNPTPFNLDAGLQFLFMAVIGGAGSPWAAVLGTLVITLVNQLLQDWLPDLIGNSGSLQAIVLGVLLILLLQHMSGGLTPRLVAMLPRGGHLRTKDKAVPALPEPTRETSPTPLLDVWGLTKRFDGFVAVNAISFQLDPRSILGLIGPNGAGKSTLFDMISGAQAPSDGAVFFAGRAVSQLAPDARARFGMARTFQHASMVGALTVLENVALGAHLRGRCGLFASILSLDGAEEAALLLEAQHRLDEIGLGALAFERAGSLPLGSQRLVEIARALSAAPRLLLLDEPAAGLRRPEKARLAPILRSQRDRGIAIILVEHNMDLLMDIADRVLVMQSGEEVAAGSPTDVARSPAVIEAYLGRAP